jgi:hypothetical protein
MLLSKVAQSSEQMKKKEKKMLLPFRNVRARPRTQASLKRGCRVVQSLLLFRARTERGFMAFTAAMSRGGFEITGPLPFTTSNSMPMAGSGVKMSENIITPSMP